MESITEIPEQENHLSENGDFVNRKSVAYVWCVCSIILYNDTTTLKSFMVWPLTFLEYGLCQGHQLRVQFIVHVCSCFFILLLYGLQVSL